METGSSSIDPVHYNTATRTPGGLIGVLPPTDDYGMEFDGQEEGSGPGEGTKKGSNTCSCLLPWCGLFLEQNGGGHRIPSGDSVGEGKQWLARLHNKRTNSSIFTSIFETLASPEMARKETTEIREVALLRVTLGGGGARRVFP